MLRSDLAAEVISWQQQGAYLHIPTQLLICHWLRTSELVPMQMVAVGLFKGRRLVAAGNRPDLDYFKVLAVSAHSPSPSLVQLQFTQQQTASVNAQALPVVAQTPSCSCIHCCLLGLQPPVFA